MSDINSIRVFPDVEQIAAAAVESVMDDLQSHEEERAAMLDNAAARGLAYQAFALGCPRPPREEERVKTLEALCHNYDINVDDAELDSILSVLNHVFNAPISMVVLFKGASPNSSPGNNLVYVKEGMGVARGDYPWRWSFCGWSMWTSPNPQIMVIPDAQQDARFCDNPYVKEPDGWLRFYCGAPLIASNGHHLGTLCFIDTSPRLLSASQCALVNNMAEMVVRHMERTQMLQLKNLQTQELSAVCQRMQRALDSCEQCVLLVDASELGFRVMHANQAWSNMIEGTTSSFNAKCTLSESLEYVNGHPFPDSQHIQLASCREPFFVDNVVLKGRKGCGPSQRLHLKFRPSDANMLDSGSVPIGIPAWISSPWLPNQHPTTTMACQSLYFVTVHQVSAAPSHAAAVSCSLNSSHRSMSSDIRSSRSIIEGLQLYHLLGKGSFGTVYAGCWHGMTVAVKVIDHEVPFNSSEDLIHPEVALTKGLRHPHIVTTLKSVLHCDTLSALQTDPHTQPVLSSLLSSSDKGIYHPGILSEQGASFGRQHSPQGEILDSTWCTDELCYFENPYKTTRASHVDDLVFQCQHYGGSERLLCNTSQDLEGLGLDECKHEGQDRFRLPPLKQDTLPCEVRSCDPMLEGATGGVWTDAHDIGVISSGVCRSTKGGMNACCSAQGCEVGVGDALLLNRACGEAIDKWGDSVHGSSLEMVQERNCSPREPSGSVVAEVGERTGARHIFEEMSFTYDETSDYNVSHDLKVSNQRWHRIASDLFSSARSNSLQEGKRLVQSWIIMELCDLGSLQDAIDKGWFLDERSVVTGRPRLGAILTTCKQVASAMAYLHSKDVIHGDLSSWNVLLTSYDRNKDVAEVQHSDLWFKAKVSDFGLARNVTEKIQTQTYGTVTHQPPETLLSGTISKAVDVYAFGVLMWQMYTSSQPWRGLSHAQIVLRVVSESGPDKLKFPTGVPRAYEALALSCMSYHDSDRPTFEVVCEVLCACESAVGGAD